MPANDTSKPDYDRDFLKNHPLPTQQDHARLAHLEAEREQRALSEAEQAELIALLAKVQGVYLSVTGLKNT